MNIVLFGPPGAGKGTQAQNLVKKFEYIQISTGDLLRDEVLKKSELGKTISLIISKGEFVTDVIVNSLIEKKISKKDFKNKIIFDGYPRNLNQVNNLEILLKKYEQKIGAVIFLNVKRETIEKRIKGRVTCEKCKITLNEFYNVKEIENHSCGKENFIKREDDNYDTIIKRYDTYMKTTQPVIEHYNKNHNFVEIDGSLKVDQITNKIEAFIKV